MSIKAVVFDLDDTLYPEYDYVLSGFEAVGVFVKSAYGISGAAEDFKALFDESREHVFDRYVQERHIPSDAIHKMVEVYRLHEPKISLSDEVKHTLIELRKNGYKLGIITDGRPEGQHAKITALGLDALVDKVILTDELGGVEFRKPNPIAFEMMCKYLMISPEEMLYVGDNPQKDFAVKKTLPITTAIVKGVLYGNNRYPEGILPDYVLADIANLVVGCDCLSR